MRNSFPTALPAKKLHRKALDGRLLKSTALSTAALLAGVVVVGMAQPALAQVWDGEVDSNFATNENWNPDGAPLNGSATISGNGSNAPFVGADYTVDTLNLSNGTLTVGDGAGSDEELEATSSVTQSGGQVNFNYGHISTSTYNLSNGTLSNIGGGLLNVRFETFQQSGGTVNAGTILDGGLSGTYHQTNGDMNGTISKVGDYNQDGGEMGGAIDKVGNYDLTNGDLSGTVKGADNFNQTGGVVKSGAHIEVTDTFTQDGGTIEAGASIDGMGTASGELKNGDMGGTITGMTDFAQSGGAMSGSVTASGTYSLSNGTLSGAVDTDNFTMTGGTVTSTATIDFDTLYDQNGGTVNAGAVIKGDTTASANLKNGTMGGTMSDIVDFTQSGGVMSGSVTASGTYSVSNGTLSGAVDTDNFTITGGNVTATATIDFDTLYDQNGGTVAAGAVIKGDGTASANLKNGTMGGTMSDIVDFTQSGGVMSGSVTASGTYGLSNGTMSGVANADQFNQTGGEVTKDVNVDTLYTLNGGLIRNGATIDGQETAAFNHQNGTLEDGGTVTGITQYVQTGGVRENASSVTADTFAQTGGSGLLSNVTADIKVKALGGTISDLAVAGTDGVTVSNGTGAGIEVETTTAGVITNGGGDGLHAEETFGGDVVIDLGAAVKGSEDGIDASTSGDDDNGLVFIATTADVTGEGGHGIKTSAVNGNTTIRLGALGTPIEVTGSDDGIHSTATGSGNITIEGYADISGGGAAGDDGIQTSAQGGITWISVNGTITGDPGIVMTSTTGALIVNGMGDVIGTLAEGILATSTSGDITVNRDGDVTGATDGISVSTSGLIDIDVGGTSALAVSGTSGSGIRINNTGGQTATVDIGADDSVTGGANGIFNVLGNTNVVNNGLVSGPVAVRANGGTVRFANTANAEAEGMLVGLAGSNVQVTNTGTWTLLEDGTGNLAGAADSFDNSNGELIFTGVTTQSGIETFTNAGGLVRLGGPTGTAQQGLILESLGTFNNAGGTVQLTNGFVSDAVVFEGNYAAGAEGRLALDIDLSRNNAGGEQLADFVRVSDNFTGATVIDFTNIAPGNFRLQDNDILIADLDPTANISGTMTANGLPALGGLIEYRLLQDANQDWVVRSEVNLDAIGGIAGNIAVVQSTLGAIVNRPSSPFVSGLAADVPAGYCGPGPWMRGVGGTVTASGESTALNSSSISEVSMNYAGAQFGLDISCFNVKELGIDVALGVIGGFNGGNSTQQLMGSVTNSNFSQSFVGAYATLAKGAFVGDLQARVDFTDFVFDNPTISLSSAELSTQRYSLGGSANYAFDLSDDMRLIPTVGFSLSNTVSNALTFTTGQTLQPLDALSMVGFIGATVNKTIIMDDQTSAVIPFATATLYNDFADYPTYVFEDTNGASVDITSQHLGLIGEGSLGVSYVKLLDDSNGGPKQFNASVRADAKYSDRVMGVGLTASARAQF